jgi:signal transduction histidine kinase
MYALPVVVVQSSQAKLINGTLFSLPPELRTTNQLDFYSKCRAGWSVCPQGYHVYVELDVDGTKFVFPGLCIKGKAKPKKRFVAAAVDFGSDQIIEFAKSVVNERQRVAEAKEEELSVLIHDLRAFSSAIYNAALLAKTQCELARAADAEDLIETVIATHMMLSSRIDLIDIVSNPLVSVECTYIPVFKKVDKVVRCFRPKAAARNIVIRLQGPSTASTWGPSIFELIPYTIIDNAVKYAPEGTHVVVDVKDGQSEVVVRVRSFGPFIDPKERFSIFQRGYRSAHAERTGQAGTGLGLTTAKHLLEQHFHGSITVQQEAQATSNAKATYFSTEFEILVPRYERGTMVPVAAA